MATEKQVPYAPYTNDPYSDEEVQRAMADRDYWEAIAPPGYRLMGFTYRHSALFSCPGDRDTINITQSHMDFFNPDQREGADEEG